MNTELMIVGGVLLLMGFLVGVMKQTWLLAGFNEKRVSNKGRLAKLVGGFEGIMGAVFIIAGFFSFPSVTILMAILLIGIFGLIIYSNVMLVDQ
jgi:hypothetical protein